MTTAPRLLFRCLRCRLMFENHPVESKGTCGIMPKQACRGATKRELPANCRHHWIIEPASGLISKGRCRSCGKEKEFKNYLAELPWNEWLALRNEVEDIIPPDIRKTVGAD